MDARDKRGSGVGLVIVVAVVALAAACSSTPPAAEAPTASKTGTIAPAGGGSGKKGTTSTAVGIGLDAIRDVDFATFTYDADSCGDPDRTDDYEVVDGTTTDEAGLSVDTEAIVYGDVTGDDLAEAVVLLTCNAGGSASAVVPVVYSISSDGDPVRAGMLAAPGRDDVAVVSASIVDGQILTDEVVFAPDDPRCCPSGTGTTIWEWNGDEFVVVNSTEDTQSTPTTRPEVDPFSIRVDGAGSFVLGMTKEELADYGVNVVTAEPGCGSAYDAVGAPEGLYLVLDDAGSVRAITVTSPAYLTEANASVDSFVLDLQSVYPDLEYFDFGEGGGQYAVFAPDRSSGIYFGASGEEVETITVTYGDQPFMDLC